jgi:hypothetical protein
MLSCGKKNVLNGIPLSFYDELSGDRYHYKPMPKNVDILVWELDANILDEYV